MPAARSIGRVLRDARDSAGLTQAEAASLVGVTSSTFARWEQGRVVPTAANLERAAEALKIDLGRTTVRGEREVLEARVAALERAVAALQLRLPPGD